MTKITEAHFKAIEAAVGHSLEQCPKYFPTALDNSLQELPSLIRELVAENHRLESAWQVETLNRKDEVISAQEKENDRCKERIAELVAENERLQENRSLSVWFGSMPESNGKQNWTAILHKGDIANGFTIARSEYQDRVRYDADCVKYIIGELESRPLILDYDGDLKATPPQALAVSGFTADNLPIVGTLAELPKITQETIQLYGDARVRLARKEVAAAPQPAALTLPIALSSAGPEYDKGWGDALAEVSRLNPQPAAVPDGCLTSRVADLLHLLQFAEITTPSAADSEQAKKAMADIQKMLTPKGAES